MSKIKNDGLDQYGAEPSNSSNLEQLAVMGLTAAEFGEEEAGRSLAGWTRVNCRELFTG